MMPSTQTFHKTVFLLAIFQAVSSSQILLGMSFQNQNGTTSEPYSGYNEWGLYKYLIHGFINPHPLIGYNHDIDDLHITALGEYNWGYDFGDYSYTGGSILIYLGKDVFKNGIYRLSLGPEISYSYEQTDWHANPCIGGFLGNGCPNYIYGADEYHNLWVMMNISQRFGKAFIDFNWGKKFELYLKRDITYYDPSWNIGLPTFGSIDMFKYELKFIFPVVYISQQK